MNAWNPPDPSDRVPQESTVTYVIHNYAGVPGDDRTVTVDGRMADIIRNEYGTLEAQRSIGITILPDRWTVDASELPY